MAKPRPVLQLSPPFATSADINEITQPEGIKGKRQRQPSRKALQNAIQNTTVELSRRAEALRSEIDNVYTALRGDTATVDESALRFLTQKYQEILTELECLYAQDKWGDTSAEAETVRQAGLANLEHARSALNKAKPQCNEDDRVSRKSRHSSRVSSSRSSSSSKRAKALAEAAAANKQAEYDRIIAEKQHLRRQQEAAFERDIALLAADKLAAVADAKLAAIENSIQEEERSQSHAPSRTLNTQDTELKNGLMPRAVQTRSTQCYRKCLTPQTRRKDWMEIQRSRLTAEPHYTVHRPRRTSPQAPHCKVHWSRRNSHTATTNPLQKEMLNA